MMLSKDGTSIIGKIGFLLPLLILFIAADAAACPEHRSGAALRTKAVKINNGGHMRTTVIGYRAPATYRLCGNTLRDTRNVAYVRDGSRRNNSARYIAVRNGESRMKYVAIRNVDRAPRYVATRHAAPAYVRDSGLRYVAVRNVDRFDDSGLRYIAVRNLDRSYIPSRARTIVRGIDIGDGSDYTTIRQAPVYVDNGSRKYVGIRNVDRYDNVSIRDIDIDDEPRYVPVRNIDRYDSGTRYVAMRDRYDDFPGEIEQIVLRDEPLKRRHVVEYSDAAFSDDDDAIVISTNSVEDACLYPATVRTAPMVETRMVSYVRDDDIDDHAFLKVRMAAPAVASYTPTSYVPMDEEMIEVEDSDIEYVAAGDRMSTVSYIPVDDDVGVVDDVDVTYVTADGLDSPCLRQVAVRECPDDIDADEISYVPVNDASLQTVSYVPVDEVEHVSYVPVDEAETVSYVPANSVSYNDVSEIDATYCPMMVSNVKASPVYSDASMGLIAVRDANYVAGLSSTGRIGGDFGYRDGFADGAEAASELDAYHPENSGDYKKATNGYEDTYGDKDLYKESYRSAYLTGYRAGFDSVGVSTNIG